MLKFQPRPATTSLEVEESSSVRKGEVSNQSVCHFRSSFQQSSIVPENTASFQMHRSKQISPPYLLRAGILGLDSRHVPNFFPRHSVHIGCRKNSVPSPLSVRTTCRTPRSKTAWTHTSISLYTPVVQHNPSPCKSPAIKPNRVDMSCLVTSEFKLSHQPQVTGPKACLV